MEQKYYHEVTQKCFSIYLYCYYCIFKTMFAKEMRIQNCEHYKSIYNQFCATLLSQY